jgi:nitronate monooxygenase
VRFAKKAESIGCDYISIDGCECAGHPGEDDVTSLVLIPVTVDAVKIPVIASGGFADARGLVAALALGAEAMNLGTRFVATQEAPAHINVKNWLVEATETDTMFVMRSLRNTERVLRNDVAEKVVELEKGGAGIAELAPLVTGRNGLRMLKDGEIDVGLMPAGQSVGLVHDIPTVGELFATIMEEARQITDERLKGMRG